MADQSAPTAPARVLSGLRILDFSRILSGPYATLILSDLGAEVIKIESIERGDETRAFPPFKGPFSHYFIALNRGKKSLALDLKSEKGREIAKALARQADVVIENFRPGVMDRLGLGYEALAAENPQLCYCAITGFGDDSPLSDKPAFDIVAQALSGVMSVNREPGGAPNKLGLPLGDMAGSIFAVFGVLAALVERGKTGRGRRIDVSMLDSLIGMLGYLAQIYFVTGAPPQPVGTRHPSLTPYGAYPTADGHVIVACLTDVFWRNFASALDQPELTADPRFSEYEKRLENRHELERIVEDRMRRNDTRYWLQRLDDFDVPNAPILDIAQALEQPHVHQRGLADIVAGMEGGDHRVLQTPLRFDGAPLRANAPPPLLGEHTVEILSTKLSMSPEAIKTLLAQGAAGADQKTKS